MARDKSERGIPKHHKKHAGGPMPVDPETFVVAIIRTAEGLGYSEVTRARHHEWEHHKHPEGIGAVVGYREASKGEALSEEALRHRWPEE